MTVANVKQLLEKHLAGGNSPSLLGGGGEQLVQTLELLQLNSEHVYSEVSPISQLVLFSGMHG